MRLAKPKPSRWRRPAAACLVVMLVLPAVRSSAGVVAVQLKRAGNGSPGRTAGGLRIVDGSTAEVLAATSVGARSRAKLGAPPGVEFAVATVARPKGLREAVSDAFRFDGGGVLKLKMVLDQSTATASARGAVLRSPAPPGARRAARASAWTTSGTRS